MLEKNISKTVSYSTLLLCLFSNYIVGKSQISSNHDNWSYLLVGKKIPSMLLRMSVKSSTSISMENQMIWLQYPLVEG